VSIPDVPPEVREAFAKYQFYHQIEVVPGVVTPGWQVVVSLTDAIRKELAQQNVKGKRVLDIGCRDGLFSFDAERMGASSVIGIDNDLSIAATEFLIPFLKSKVQMRSLNLYDLNSEKDGLFDFVIFCGVLYHLRYPFLGIDRIADIMTPGATLLLETAIWMTPNGLPLLYCPRPDDSPYEPTSVTFYNNAGLIDTLRAAGFEDIECRQILHDHDDIETPNKVGRGIYTCRKSVPGERQATLKKYWVGTHSLNSSVNENLSFLTEWDKQPRG
jgi:SAM-dependent methyltransferase